MEVKKDQDISNFNQSKKRQTNAEFFFFFFFLSLLRRWRLVAVVFVYLAMPPEV